MSEREQNERKHCPNRKRSAVGSVLAILALAACGPESREPSTQTAVATTEESACEPFVIYSQNRFRPAGAVGRAEPSINAGQVASFTPNEILIAIGYIESASAAYPGNPEVIDGDHWFIVQAEQGLVYVNDAAVRAAKTTQDPDGGFSADYGPIVTLDPECNMTN